MNKRNKYAAKSNINTRKGTNVACPTPRQHLPKQKQRNRRLTTTPCPADRGAWPSICRKDKAIEASISRHGGVPSSTRVVVNAKIRRIQANLDSTDTLLHTGPCPSDTGACGANADKLQLMKKEKVDGHGAVPNGHGAVSGLLCRL